MTALGDVLRERRETPDELEVAQGKIPIVAKIGFNDGRLELRREAGSKTNMILVMPGDLLVSGINAAKGAIAIYGAENERPAAATIHYSAYEVIAEKSDINYLWLYLRSSSFRSILLEALPGGIKTELRAKRLLPIEVPLPPLDEQRRIVARIEGLATKVEAAHRLKETTKYETDRFWKVLSQMARSTPYAEKELGEIVEFLDGRRIPLRKADREKRRGPYPYYGASGIIDYIDDYLFDEDLLLLSEDGANLVNRSTPIAFIASGKYWVNNHAHVLKPLANVVDLYFLAYALADYDVGELNFASLVSVKN